jgi:hypothetical protein
MARRTPRATQAPREELKRCVAHLNLCRAGRTGRKRMTGTRDHLSLDFMDDKAPKPRITYNRKSVNNPYLEKVNECPECHPARGTKQMTPPPPPPDWCADGSHATGRLRVRTSWLGFAVLEEEREFTDGERVWKRLRSGYAILGERSGDRSRLTAGSDLS